MDGGEYRLVVAALLGTTHLGRHTRQQHDANHDADPRQDQSESVEDDGPYDAPGDLIAVHGRGCDTGDDLLDAADEQ